MRIAMTICEWYSGTFYAPSILIAIQCSMFWEVILWSIQSFAWTSRRFQFGHEFDHLFFRGTIIDSCSTTPNILENSGSLPVYIYRWSSPVIWTLYNSDSVIRRLAIISANHVQYCQPSAQARLMQSMQKHSLITSQDRKPKEWVIVWIHSKQFKIEDLPAKYGDFFLVQKPPLSLNLILKMWWPACSVVYTKTSWF